MTSRACTLVRVALLFLVIVYFVFATNRDTFADGKNIKAEELTSHIENEMTDILSKIESNRQKTIVLVIPDESGAVIIEPWTVFIDSQSKIKAMNINEIERKIVNIYNKCYYDTILLKVCRSINYEYLYNIIYRIEGTLIKNKIFGNEKLFIRPKYIFEKPLLKEDVIRK